MTSDPPPSSSGGSPLPPRHRPILRDLTKDTTELDLWAFEDDLELGQPDSGSMTGDSSRSAAGDIPAPRERQATKVRDTSPPPQVGIPSGGERIQMNVSKGRVRQQTAGPAAGPTQPGSDFDDLEHWDDVPKGQQIEDLPVMEIPTPEAHTITPESASAAEQIRAQQPEVAAAPPAVAQEDEFSPTPREGVKPLSLHPRWHLSHAERIGLIVLVAMLLVGGLATLGFSLMRLPSESARAKTNDFPIKGTRITIDSAVSYWRSPITGGPTPDTFRRGTQLLPVLELKPGGGSGAIRVLFRNDEGVVIGDAVTRAVRGADSLKIAATAGFDDPGMHAAYRTGESKPWTIEVFEAASEDSSGRDFKRLFEMNISTDRR